MRRAFRWMFRRLYGFKPVTLQQVEEMRLFEVTGLCQYDNCDKPAQDIAFKAPGKLGCYCEKHKQIA